MLNSDFINKSFTLSLRAPVVASATILRWTDAFTVASALQRLRLPLLLLLLLLLRCLASAARCAECFHCTVLSFFLFLLFFSISPPLPLRQDSGLFDPVIIASLFGCPSGCSPDSPTPSRRPHVWSAVHTDAPCVFPPCHVSIRHTIFFVH